jgi:dipeptidyl aminopeptidase/acylaminoacyl peptidase
MRVAHPHISRPAFRALSRRRAFVCAWLMLAAPLTARAQSTRPMTVDDVIDLVQVSSPRISPDGRRVLYTVSELGAWKDNKRVTSIWIADADGSNARRFLANEKDRAPAWSPDGRSVAFLSSRDAAGGGRDAEAGDGAAQIYVIPVDGGEASKLTDHKGAIRSFEWAKDNASIVFLAAHAKPDADKSREKAGDDAIVVDEGANGQERGDFSELWRIAIADKTERAITHDDALFVESFRVSPDASASRIAVVYRRENTRNGQYHAEVGVVDAATGALTAVTHNNAPEQNVQWSPEGKLLSYLAPSATSWDLAEEKLWVVPAEGGGEPRKLGGSVAGAIGQYAWSADGRSIVVGAAARARGAVYAINVATGAVTPIASGDWAGRLESVSTDGKRGVAVVSTPATPGEVVLIDLTTGKRTAVTHANPKFGGFALSQFKAITWKSKDGLEVEGMLWLPADYKPGTRLPLILSVHGGPAGAWDVSFRGINHVYTGLGWAVLEPNVRGSSSYGDALLRGNMKDIGGGDYQDLMAGVDALIAGGIADPDHLAIRGWSYGGILGGWTLTQTSRFKAASLGAMVADWTSEYAMGFNHDVRLWYIGGAPWESAESYRRQSSYTHIAKVTTPTLLLHGERDTTDTIGQSMMYYQGLKDRGVPARFVRFPREPHGFREPHHIRIRDVEEIAWLMKYARGIDWKPPERKDADKPADRKTTDQ